MMTAIISADSPKKYRIFVYWLKMESNKDAKESIKNVTDSIEDGK